MTLWVEIPVSPFGRIVQYVFGPATLLGGMVCTLNSFYQTESSVMMYTTSVILHCTRGHNEPGRILSPFVLHIYAGENCRGTVSPVYLRAWCIRLEHILSWI